MPDATYVGAGMPCGNCGNPLTLGQPHKCGRTPDQPRDDGTHGRRWLAGKLPPDKSVVLAHHYDALLETVREDPDKWSFRALVHVAQLMLDETYPDDVFGSGPLSLDSGARFTTKLREALRCVHAEPDTPAPASPDERLREALREIVAAFPSPPDREMDDEEIEKWYADHGDWFQRLAALAAADREAPDEETKR